MGANSISISFFRSSADTVERRLHCVGPRRRDKQLRTSGGERPSKRTVVGFHYQFSDDDLISKKEGDKEMFLRWRQSVIATCESNDIKFYNFVSDSASLDWSAN